MACPRRVRTTLASVLSGAAALGFAGAAGAAIIVDSSQQDIAPFGGAVHDVYVPSLFTASGEDLLEGLLATSTQDSQYELSAGLTAITNGSLSTVYGEGGPGGDEIDHAAYATVRSVVQPGPVFVEQTELTFDLGGLFDIKKVDVYSGWNDSGRDDFSFELRVSVDGVDYTTIADYNKGGDDTGAITTPVTNLRSIFDDGDANIATGVRYLQLWVYDADNGNAGIVEIDAFGTQVGGLIGDTDGDGDIDDFDLINAIVAYTGSLDPGVGGKTIADGDTDNDQDVDDFDLINMIVGYTGSLSAPTTAVPEPTSVALLGLGGLLIARRRR